MTDESKCPKCFGTGQLPIVRPKVWGRRLMPVFCPDCDATELKKEGREVESR
jgi:DnaJ-class molecular chaperone